MDEYLTLISSLSRVFQSNDPTVDCVKSRVESISSRLSQLASSEVLKKLMHTEMIHIDDEVVQYKGVSLEAGRHGRGERHTPTVDSLIQQAVDDCLSICIGTQDQLRDRFSSFLVNKVLNAATVFEYRNWPENEDLETYGDSEVKEVYLLFKKRLDKDGNMKKTIMQWLEIKKYIRRQYGKKYVKFHDMWSKAMKEDEPEGRFKLILRIVRLIMV